MLEQQRRHVRRLERETAAHGEVANDAERIEVAPAVQRFAHCLLGAHEVRRSHDLAGIGVRIVGVDVRDTEIGHERAPRAFLDEDVVGLHVAMHHAATVRVRECPRHFTHETHGLRRRQRPPRAKALAERLAGHVAHHEVDETARLADTMNGHDIGMRQTGSGAGLANEPFARAWRDGQVRGQHLDGDESVELDVAREIHDAHTAAADLAFERVLAGEGGLEVEEFGVERGHVSFPT
jgi:hypothetical protein